MPVFVAFAEAADQATNLLKALSGRSRLMILCQLVDGEQADVPMDGMADWYVKAVPAA